MSTAQPVRSGTPCGRSRATSARPSSAVSGRAPDRGRSSVVAQAASVATSSTASHVRTAVSSRCACPMRARLLRVDIPNTRQVLSRTTKLVLHLVDALLRMGHRREVGSIAALLGHVDLHALVALLHQAGSNFALTIEGPRQHGS